MSSAQGRAVKPVSKPRPSPKELLFRLTQDPLDEPALEALIIEEKMLTTAALGSILTTLAQDPMTFATNYQCSREQFAERIGFVYERLKSRIPESAGCIARGALGFIRFTALALSVSQNRADEPYRVEILKSLRGLLDDPAVKDCFYQLYRPSAPRGRVSAAGESSEENQRLSREYWDGLERDSLHLHRVGSTSFILRCRVHILSGEWLALKCLLFPYTQVVPVAHATLTYALDYPAGAVPATARVRASTAKWILMDFIEGPTLQELLDERARSDRGGGPSFRTDMLTSVGTPLLEALRELHSVGKCHHDLTPANIIVVKKQYPEQLDDVVDRVVLIDLGRNYLYTHEIGLPESRESLFVAPEIKKFEGRVDDGAARNRNIYEATDTADVYSLGLILVELADPKGALNGVIPDSIYQYAPPLARFLEDLIDANPGNRLLVFGSSNPENLYTDLCRIFADELKILPSLPNEIMGWWAATKSAIELLRPSSRQVKQRYDIWRKTREKTRDAHAAIIRYSGWLFGWSVVCTATWYVTFSVSLLWSLRDLGVNGWDIPVVVIQKLTNSNAGLPFIDSLRAPGYAIGDWRDNLGPRVVGLTTCLAQTKYYQNIMAGITARDMRGRLARVTEVSLRYVSFCTLLPVLYGNLVQPRAWLWLLTGGYAGITINNYLTYRLASRSLHEAATFSTVSKSPDSTLKAYSTWWSSLGLYVMALVGIAIGLQIGLLHDFVIYVFAASLMNISVYYIIKCIYFGPNIRGCLARAFIAGERAAASRTLHSVNGNL